MTAHPNLITGIALDTDLEERNLPAVAHEARKKIFLLIPKNTCASWNI